MTNIDLLYIVQHTQFCGYQLTERRKERKQPRTILNLIFKMRKKISKSYISINKNIYKPELQLDLLSVEVNRYVTKHFWTKAPVVAILTLIVNSSTVYLRQ